MNRAWTYVISSQLSDAELEQLEKAGQTFVHSWTAHENQLSAEFTIYKKRIIIVKVNENVNDASGCSIDKLTRFIKVSESMFGTELLNRQMVAYKKNDTVQVTPAAKVKDLLLSGDLNEDTIVFNTALATDKELDNWQQPLKNTWLNKYLSGN
jgi:hypothetical protein